MGESNNWRSPSFRENIVRKLNDHITALEMNVKNDAIQMESNIYQKATTEHEYLSFIGRLIMYLREKSKVTLANGSTLNGSGSNLERDEKNDDKSSSSTISTESTNLSYTSQPHSSAATRVFGDPNKRPVPTSSQKLDILRTAIATVLQSTSWRTEEAKVGTHQRSSLKLFGQYVVTQLGQIEDEGTLLATQHQIMSLINKAI